MQKKIKNKIIYLLVIFATICSCFVCYGKTISVGNMDVRLYADVMQENLTTEKKVNEEDETISENNKKEPKDKSVNIELSIRNNNPYETADVTIVEKVNSGFKQLGTNKIDRRISFKLESNNEKTFKYNYKYEKHIILDQFNKLIYGDNDSYEEIHNDNNIVVGDKNTNLEIDDSERNGVDNSKDKIIEEKKKNKQKNSNLLLIIFICIVIGLAVVYGFTLFLRSLNDKDIDLDDFNKYNGFIIIFVLSLVISIIGKTNIYASNYEPIIYQKGQSFTKTIIETVEFNERYFNFSYEITVKYENKHEITSYEIDTDGDLLSDALEYLYMTDINNKDTDGDGLLDYLEVMILNYNPNSKWTFNDGRNDGYRDYDGDGLRNLKEVEYGTDLTMQDTDGDNLSDYEEVEGIKSKDGLNIYQTNPLLKDTDEDGLNDDLEIKLGLDPTNPMTDGVTLDSERKIEQEYNTNLIPQNLREGDIYISQLKSSTSGDIDESIRVSNYYNQNLLNVNAIVSSLFEISNSEDDKIDITLDVSKATERKTKLVIVKYVDGILEPIDTELFDDTITANIDSSGIYGVVDSEIILRDLSIFIDDYR